MSYVYLLYGNRNEDSIIFKSELDELAKKYEGQFVVENTLSSPKKSKSGFFSKAKITWEGKVGRIDSNACSVFLDENKSIHKDTEYFICGPGGMIDTVEEFLTQKGIDLFFKVAEETIIFISGLFLLTFFINPKIKSVFIVRSWISSIINTL